MDVTTQTLPTTARTRLGRHSERAKTSRADLYAVLDAGMICHLGVINEDVPVVLPTAYGRVDDTLYLHGSSANRSMMAADGQEICVTVTHFDGLVCARAVFSHSINYRSAVIFGEARLVTADAERLTGLRAVTEHLIPGRWDAVRSPTRKELAATCVLALPLTEASVKVRTGGPIDEPQDVDSPLWAGVVPAVLTFGTPIAAPGQPPGRRAPAHIQVLAGRAGNGTADGVSRFE